MNRKRILQEKVTVNRAVTLKNDKRHSHSKNKKENSNLLEYVVSENLHASFMPENFA